MHAWPLIRTFIPGPVKHFTQPIIYNYMGYSSQYSVNKVDEMLTSAGAIAGTEQGESPYHHDNNRCVLCAQSLQYCKVRVQTIVVIIIIALVFLIDH